MDEQMQRLMEYNPKDVKRITFAGSEKYARVCSVYDGDTITCIFELSQFNNYPVKVSCRMAEYDAPEMNSPEEHVREKAHAAKEYLASRILDKIVWVQFLEDDKYKRPLIKVYTLDADNKPSICLNTEMCEKGHGWEYHGGKKIRTE